MSAIGRALRIAAALCVVGALAACSVPVIPVMPHPAGIPAVAVSKDTMVQAGMALELIAIPQTNVVVAKPVTDDNDIWADIGLNLSPFNASGNVGLWKRLTPTSEGRREHWAFRASLGSGLGDLLGETEFELIYVTSSALFQYVLGSNTDPSGDFFTLNMGLEAAVPLGIDSSANRDAVSLVSPSFELRGDFGVYNTMGGFIGLKLYPLALYIDDSQTSIIPIYLGINGGLLF